MATQNVETVTSKADLVLVTLAVLAAVAGVLGFTFLTKQPTLARVGVLIGGLVIAIVIFDGSKPTTAPLRRITLYCAKRGSAPLATGLPGSPTIRSRDGDEDGAWAGA